MKKLLVLFANGFPFDQSEPFLALEIPLYPAYFDHTLLISGKKGQHDSVFPLHTSTMTVLPDRTMTLYLPDILEAIPWVLTDTMFYKELFSLVFRSGFSWTKLHSLLAVTFCGNHRALLAHRWLRQHPEYELQAIYGYWMQIPAYAALRLKRITNCTCPTISRAHGYDLYANRVKDGYQPFHQQLYERLDLIAPVSLHGKQTLVARYGSKAGLSVHYLGAADHQTRNPCCGRSPLRLVSCSRVVPVKRLDRIIDALCMTAKEEPIIWTHLGGGDGLDALKRLASKLPGHVIAHFPGQLTGEQIYACYEHTPFHAFLNVSESEGISVAMMEAMSFGIPVIATAIGGTPELVHDHVNGYLLDSAFQPLQLVSALQAISHCDDAAFASMRAAARCTYETSFRIPDNHHTFLAAIRGKDGEIRFEHPC